MIETKDIWYCPEKRHHVPMTEKNHINTAVSGKVRYCCNDCKARIQEGRDLVKGRAIG